jgi:hypothetical protein
MSERNVIRGIAITPPLLGRITLGHTELRGSGDEVRGIPKKDDHFTITTLMQNADRSWEVHPLQATLVKGNEKLTRIPVRIAYNDVALTLHNSYSAFDAKTGRVLCCSDGETAKRITEDGVKPMACPRPEACEYGQRQRCRNMTRAYFQVDGQDDPLASFVLRSTSWNTLTSLTGRLERLSGLTGGKLAGMPLMLILRSKTTTQSCRTPIYYADLTLRDGMTLFDTIEAARAYQKALADAELFQDEMEASIRAGLANGDFADEIEDLDEWIGDDDLAGQAEKNLQKQGLRGLDNLAKRAVENAPVGPEAMGTVTALPAAAPATAAAACSVVATTMDARDLPAMPPRVKSVLPGGDASAPRIVRTRQPAAAAPMV